MVSIKHPLTSSLQVKSKCVYRYGGVHVCIHIYIHVHFYCCLFYFTLMCLLFTGSSVQYYLTCTKYAVYLDLIDLFRMSFGCVPYHVLLFFSIFYYDWAIHGADWNICLSVCLFCLYLFWNNVLMHNDVFALLLTFTVLCFWPPGLVLAWGTHSIVWSREESLMFMLWMIFHPFFYGHVNAYKTAANLIMMYE